MAASASEKEYLLLGLLSGQMREIAVSLARSTTAAGQRKDIRLSTEFMESHLCTKKGDEQAEENSKIC